MIFKNPKKNFNLSEDLIKALAEKIFQEFGVTQEDGKVLRELFSLYYFKMGDFSDWLTEVDSHTNRLLDKIDQESGEKKAKWQAQLIQWCSMAGAFATTLKKTKAQQFYQQGINYAEFILAQGETAEAVRQQVLNLYFSAGVLQGQAPFNDAAQAIQLWQRGLEHAETFLTQGETASKVRELTLELYGATGFTQAQPPFSDVAQAIQFWQRGLEHAETFLAQGETASNVHQWVLQLYINVGNAFRQAPFNDVTQASELYQRGINHAEVFLAQGETAWAVRGRVLELYFSAGLLQIKAPFNEAAQAFDFYQRGINQAEAFLAQGEKTSAVREWALKLYFNAGIMQIDAPFNDAVQAFEFYQRGIKHAEAFLVQGEKTSEVRELVINLYFNAGVLQKQAPFNDAEQAFEFYQRGVNHTEAFLAQGEKTSAVRERVLNLYVNAGVLQAQVPFNNAAQAFEFYQRGIKHAEDFLTQGETASLVREQVLNLYVNIGVLQGQTPFNDATQAFEFFQHGINHAEAFLAEGETASPLRERVLELYVNAGVLQAQVPFNNAAQAFEFYQRGIKHAEDFLTQGETASPVRKQVLNLYVNAGVLQRQVPFNDAAQALEFYQRGLNHAEAFLAQGETTSDVREPVLKLYLSTGVTHAQAPVNDAVQAFEFFQCGINHAEIFLAQGETASNVREQVLKLYHNAGFLQEKAPFNDTKQAFEFYQHGVNHAEIFLAQGEAASAVREQVLKLYRLAGVMRGKPPFNDLEQKFEYYQRGFEHAEQFLAQGEIAFPVREQVLRLYTDAGLAQGQAPFNDVAQACKLYQRGLKHVETFLAQGETTSKVREQVLELYDALTDEWRTSRQRGPKISYLPRLGLWSWDSLGKTLHNWHRHLKISHSQADFANFLAGFQKLLHTLLLVWHNPQRAHRHFVATDTLLAISESLYGLAQAEENKRLHTVYRCLQEVQNSPMVQEARDLPLQKQALEQQSQALWQKLDKHPEAFDDLATLQKLSWWKKISHWRTVAQLRDNIRVSLRLTPYHLAQNSHWQQAVKRSEKVLFYWLRDAIDKKLNLPNRLEELPAIVLGILLANRSQGEVDAKTILETWQHNPPWQDVDSLQATLAGSGWQTWVKAKKPALRIWLDLLGRYPTAKRLTIANEIAHFEQPHLQKWLGELLEGKAGKLIMGLSAAWETAQQQASRLAQLLTALIDPNYRYFQGDWFAEREVKDEIYLMALAAVILGDASEQVETALQDWLYQQGSFDESTPVLDTLNALKHRFDRAVSVYQPSYPPLGETVHDWAKVLLAENLRGLENFEDLEMLWQLLERARIGLTGLTLKLPNDWKETLGKELWEALASSISLIENGYETEGEMWPLFKIWLDRVNGWLLKPPTVAACQQYLQPQEALVQLFLDPVRQRFRVLWLDKNGLVLKDLPDECALESVWLEKQLSVISEQLSVMESAPVRLLAETLSDWASGFSQLTVIFPAPLGLLPWETLPLLERLLVREISLAHWLHTSSLGC